MRAVALLLILASTEALADRRELFMQVEGGLGLQYLREAATESTQAFGPGLNVQLHVFYGVTNSLHLGGYARGFYAADVAFPGVTPTLADGSTPSGTLYENMFGAGAGLLARWRFDTGYFVAPFVQLELGAAWARFDQLQLIPDGLSFGINLPSRDVISPDGRAVLGLEIRLMDLLVISIQFGARRSLSALEQWQFDAGAGVGVVF